MVSQILHLILCIGFHGLGFLTRFIAYKFYPPFYLSFKFVHAFSQLFIAYFSVISLRHSLVSGIYIPVVILTWIIQTPSGGGFEYCHRSPVSRRSRIKQNPVLWVLT
jgi:hypothetical protein